MPSAAGGNRASLTLTFDLQAGAKSTGLTDFEVLRQKGGVRRVKGQEQSVYGQATLSKGVIPAVLGHLHGNTSTTKRYRGGLPRQPQQPLTFLFFPLTRYLICQQQYISALLSPKLFTPTGGEDPQTFS